MNKAMNTRDTYCNMFCTVKALARHNQNQHCTVTTIYLSHKIRCTLEFIPTFFFTYSTVMQASGQEVKWSSLGVELVGLQGQTGDQSWATGYLGVNSWREKWPTCNGPNNRLQCMPTVGPQQDTWQKFKLCITVHTFLQCLQQIRLPYPTELQNSTVHYCSQGKCPAGQNIPHFQLPKHLCFLAKLSHGVILYMVQYTKYIAHMIRPCAVGLQ